MHPVPGTQGYERAARRFIEISQALSFHVVCKDFIGYLPPSPGRILDAGAGAGQNAAALAAMGHAVVAVEPLKVLLDAARVTYAGLSVSWRRDSLPDLASLGERQRQFDVILVDAVWHHLDEAERQRALTRFAYLLDDGGVCALSLRNGPAGVGTCVYPTDASHTIAQANAVGLRCIMQLEDQPSLLPNKEDVIWAKLVLQKNPA